MEQSVVCLGKLSRQNHLEVVMILLIVTPSNPGIRQQDCQNKRPVTG